jgi:hypothetical protein
MRPTVRLVIAQTPEVCGQPDANTDREILLGARQLQRRVIFQARRERAVAVPEGIQD